MPAGTPIQVRFPDEELRALDGYRREQRNPLSRAQAIRKLLRAGLINGEMTRFQQSIATVIKGRTIMPTFDFESPRGA